MRLVACVKQVPDSEARVTPRPDRPVIDERDISFVLNPYDEYAVEEAVRIKEAKGESDVAVLCVGPPRSEEALRRCLAAGADRALRVWDDHLGDVDGAVVARLLALALERVGFDLVLCGRLAIDDAAGEVGGRVAELLGVAHATAVSALSVEGDRIIAEREVDSGLEVIELPLPSVITAQKGLNEPRYPAIPAIMKARRLPIQQLTVQELGVEPGALGDLSRRKVVTLDAVETERRRRRIEGEPDAVARDLALLLRDDARAL